MALWLAFGAIVAAPPCAAHKAEYGLLRGLRRDGTDKGADMAAFEAIDRVSTIHGVRLQCQG